MANKIIDKDTAVLWQKYFDGEMELNGEPAIIVRSYGEMVSITQEDKEILINDDTIPVLIKLLKAYLKGESFHEVKL